MPSGRWLSCIRFWLMRAPWASQSSHTPSMQWWMWLRRMVTSIAACSLMPAVSAPPSCWLLQTWWMWQSSMVENTAPMRPTMPVCSQWWISQRRTMWPPTFSFSQPWYWPRHTASRSIWVGDLTCFV